METQSTYQKQKLAFASKTKDWREANVDYFIGRSTAGISSGITSYEKKQINYDLYNSKFNRKDFQFLTNPFGMDTDDNFPANLQNFNIIRPKIDLLIGEETKRPFNYRVIQSNPESISAAEEVEKQKLIEYVKAITAQELGQEPDKQGVMDPEQIEQYMKYSYNDLYEKVAQQILKYLSNKLNITDEFIKGWKDALIAGEEIYYIGNREKDPFVERINPVYFDYDKDPDMDNIEDGEWATRLMRMTPSSAWDRFKDILKPSDLDKLTEGENHINSRSDQVNYNFIHKELNNNTSFGDSNYIDVYHVVWSSYQKVGYIAYVDEYGAEQEDMVSEGYIPTGEEKVTEGWIVQVWEGYRFGSDIYAGIEPTSYMKLPYTGGTYSDTNSRNVSIIDIMKPIQYQYIAIWYRLDLMLSRDKGKVITIDITQIPKSQNVDFKKWAHYLTAMGINLVNPYEEGWEINRGGHPSSFNQFSSIDLTMANVISGYIGLLAKLEEMIGELSGVSKQRQGSISASELVGNVERAVIQSSHITEPLFWKHNQIKKRVLQQLINVAKSVWNGTEKKLSYILDDMARQFISIPGDIDFAEFDIFVTDATKENQRLESLRSLAQPAMQAGASLNDVASLYLTDSLADIKKQLKDIDEKRQKREEAMAQQGQAASEQANQVKSGEIEAKDTMNIRDNETKFKIAALTDDDELELKALEDKKEKDDKDNKIKNEQLAETKRHNIKAEEISKIQKQTTK